MKDKHLLIILVLVIVFVNYHSIDSILVRAFTERDFGVVDRVVDGDTLVFNGEKVRLLGINTPEKGEKYYSEAKEYLEQINGSRVYLEYGSDKKDRYGRILAYVFYEGRNINEELIDQGLANPYFPSGKDKYYSLFFDDWKNCLIEGKNLCSSKIDDCLSFDWKPKEDSFVIEETCGKNFDLSGWSVKDEGRKKYVFSDYELEAYGQVELNSTDFLKDYVWTYSGDSIFVRDSSGKLVFFDYY
jgi:hypothetical protein